jgi:type I restriction enzyme S subunit
LLAQRVACVRAFKNTNQNYLFYCINSKRFEDYVFRIQTGSSVPHISKAQIEEYPIPDIELSTQSKVAKILSDLDRKIQINNQINSEIESMTRLIFDYWFIQFDFPDEKGKPYKSSGGKMVYNDELNSYIPEFWKVNALINISKITTGKLDSNAEVAGGKYPFFTCAKKPVTIDNFKYDGDVILIAGNNANGNFHVNRYSGKFNAYQRTYIVSANSEEYLNYLHQVLLRQMKIYKHRGRGSQTKFLTIGMLTEIQLFEPKDNLMYEYHKITAPLHEKQMHILRENKELESMRDWLLPMLMNGQVTVKSA